MSNFMSNSDALQVLGTYANSIKAATPIEITYSQFQQLTPQQQESGNYIVSDYPGSDLQVVDEVADNNMKAVTSNAVYDKFASMFKGGPYTLKFITDGFDQNEPFVLTYPVACFFCFGRTEAMICGFANYNDHVSIIKQEGSSLSASASSRTLTLSSTLGGTAIHGFAIYI